MQNITQFLDRNSEKCSEKVLTFSESKLSFNFSEILEQMSKIADMLLENGFSKGDRLLIYLNNSPEYLFSYFAAWRLAGIVIPVNRTLTVPEVSYMIEQGGAEFVITDEEGKKSLEEICKSKNIQVFTDGEIKSRKFERIVPAVLCKPDTVCQIQYTSGTTGRPKGAMLTHGGWKNALINAGNVLSLTRDDVYLGIYPMCHVGLVWGIAALYFCTEFVEMERYNFTDYIKTIDEHKITIASGMPPVFHSFLNVSCFSSKDEKGEGKEEKKEKKEKIEIVFLKKSISTVRGMISGGGVLHHEIWKPFYDEFKIPIYNAYGLSETIVVGTGTCILPDDYPFADRFQSVGRVTENTHLKIVDPDNSDIVLSQGEIGEICLKGPSVALGYWEMPEESSKTFLEDGWFLTGDMGYIDSDGRLSIVDRKKEMIVMSGWKIYPNEVESVLLNHPFVSDAAVFGVSDPHRYEIPIAALILSETGKSLDFEEISKELTKYCKKNLAPYKIPRDYYILNTFPRVNGWKLLRKELRLSYENDKTTKS